MIAIIVGVVMLIGGAAAIATSGSHRNAEPKCNGEIMTPDQECRVTRNGGVDHVDTYEKRLANARRSHPGQAVAGGLFVLGGGALDVIMIREIRKGRRQ